MSARIKLAELMRERGLHQADVAHELGTIQSAVSRWLAGKAVPKWRSMLKVQDWSDGRIKVNDWIDDQNMNQMAETIVDCESIDAQ